MRPDRGATGVQYAALLLVAAGIAGVVGTGTIPDKVEEPTGRALCVLFNCTSTPPRHVTAVAANPSALPTHRKGTDFSECLVDGTRQIPCLEPVDWGPKISDTDSTEKGNEDILDSKLLADCQGLTPPGDRNPDQKKEDKKNKEWAKQNGTGKVGDLDSCTFEPDGDLGTFMKWSVSGVPVNNCTPGATADIKSTTTDGEGRSTAHSETVGTSVGFTGSVTLKSDKPVLGETLSLDISAGFENSESLTETWTKTVTVSNGETIIVKPGYKAVRTVGVEYRRVRGRVRLNYGTRVNGHYIWYANYVEAWVPTGYTEQGQDQVPCDKTLINGV
ncbi:hypothetical protein BTM25_28730 [Actinomadura rubteroloni]|uniref:Uncharacterized protein n=1 Tax=Actinomadura rubteroloni TaxID=1926885 RepID=A0A2P4UGQ9_9ACTN|nr:hypothetical protein [Actinomadura rubteroloni]POM24245.1 hypothetical protein BTM25_28730 [Actinomadura rubteroloni]